MADSTARRRVLRLESLESRRVLATVDTLLDVVDPQDGVTSLREAIAAATSGETIDFSVAGAIVLDPALGDLVIAQSMSIVGPGADQLTIDGGHGNDGIPNTRDGSRVFTIDDGDFESSISVLISGLTVTGADFNAFSAETFGGAIGNVENLSIVDSVVTGNAIFGNGGGVYSGSGILSLIDTQITSNSAVNGAGVFIRSGVGDTLVGITLADNIARDDGGGVYIGQGSLLMGDVRITGNSAARGGGLFLQFSGLSLFDSTIADNDATSAGGGLFAGDFSSAVSPIQIRETTISGNSVTGSTGRGGGIHIAGGTLEITNSTISGNSAPDSGGGVNRDGGSTIIEFTTITGNAAANGGGVRTIGNLTIRGSIVAANAAANAPDVLASFDLPAPLVEFSLIGSNAGSQLAESGSEPNAGGNLIGGPVDGLVDPRLGPLADNGGPTFTHALLFDSPAIDAGPTSVEGETLPTFDQRGAPFARVVDGDLDGVGRADMGAFESTRRLVVDTLVDELDDDLSPGDVSLRDLIAFAAANPTFERVQFAPSLAGGTIELALGPLTIGASVIIDASDLEQPVIVDAGAISAGGRVFTVDDGAASLIEVEISNLTLTGGDAPDGGAILTSENLSLVDVIVDGNAAMRGGGIFVRQGTLNATGVTIRANSATLGGGVFVEAGSVDFALTSIESNSATGNFRSGGGVFNQAGDVTIASSTVSGNNASDGGGALNNAGQLTIVDSTISGNAARDSGGGVYNVSGQVLIRNSTISGNRADDSGGGVYVWDAASASLAVEFSTITRNSAATSRGGGVAVNASLNLNPSGGAATIVASIVSGNTGGDVTTVGIFLDPSRYFESGGFNLLGNGNALAAFAGEMTGLADPGLLDLADNGGPTQTHALLPDSPAVDAIARSAAGPLDVPGFDQRGELFSRPLGPDANLDIGAFELEAGDVTLQGQVLQDALGGDFDGDGAVDSSDIHDPELGFSARFGRGLTGSDFLTWQRNLGWTASGDAKSARAESAHAHLDLAYAELAAAPYGEIRTPRFSRRLAFRPVNAPSIG